MTLSLQGTPLLSLRGVAEAISKSGISKFLELAERGNIVLMCKERYDAGWRRKYIAATLADKGIKTIYLT